MCAVARGMGGRLLTCDAEGAAPALLMMRTRKECGSCEASEGEDAETPGACAPPYGAGAGAKGDAAAGAGEGAGAGDDLSSEAGMPPREHAQPSSGRCAMEPAHWHPPKSPVVAQPALAWRYERGPAPLPL